MEQADRSRLRVCVLGPVRAWWGREPRPLGPPQRRAVLAVLALAAGRPVGRAELVNALWPEAPPAGATNVIQTHVKHLRRALEPGRPSRAASVVLPAVGPGYALRVESSAVDALLFHRLVADVREARRRGDVRWVWRAGGEAVRLWSTPAADVPVLATHPPVAALVAEWQLLLGWYAEVANRHGRADEVLALLEEQALMRPLDEQVQVLLLRAYASLGRRADAFAVYGRARRRLAVELGIDAGKELVSAYEELLHAAAAGRPPAPLPAGEPDVASELAEPEAAAAAVVPAQLPPDVPWFTGRESHLARLDELLAGRDGRAHATTVILAVSGTAGVGKTALAVHWAHRVRGHFPDGQIYLNLRGFDPMGAAASPAEAIRQVLDALHVSPADIPADPAAQAALYRSLLADRRILVVLDNARDAQQVRPLLPGSPRCLVLVTSRNRLTGLVAGEGAHPLILDVMSGAEAHELVTHRLGGARVAEAADAVDAIVAACAWLPLALAVVAARAATHPQLPLTALADELDEGRGRLDALAGTDPATDVRAVFSGSYQALTPDAARLFRLLGLPPGPDISQAAVASLAALPAGRIRSLLAELVDAHLLTESAPGRYTFHDLLRAYAHHLAHIHDPDDQRDSATRRILDHYLHTAFRAAGLLHPHRDPISLTRARPGVTPEHLPDIERALAWFTAEHQTLVACVEQAAESRLDPYPWQLAWTLADFLDRQGHWHDRIAVQRHALAATRRTGDPAAQALAHRHLARAYRQVGRNNDARTEFDHALDLYRRCGDQVGEAFTHHNLAAMYERQGDHRDALHHALQAVHLYEACGHQPGHANALNAAGWCHAHLGEHRQGIAQCQRALAIQQDIGDRPGEAATFDSLGYIHDQLGEHDEAVNRYRSAIGHYRDLGDRYHEAETLTNLGHTYHAAGHPDTARHTWRQALAILDDLGHPDADTVRRMVEPNVDVRVGLRPRVG